MVPVYIVNLESDREKRYLIQKQLDGAGIKYEFVDAVDGSKLSAQEKESVYTPQRAIEVFKRELSKGEIGCALSHLKIYRKMVAQEVECAVILEDDVELCSDFLELVENFKEFQNECDCLLLGHNDEIKRDVFLYTSLWHKKKYIKNYKLYRFTKVAFGTYGYIITLKGARKLLNACKTIEKPIDHYTGGFDVVDCWGLVPRCVKISAHEKAKSKIVSERDRLKATLHQVRYDSWFGKWANRARLLLRLCALKVLPLEYARRWAKRVFQNRRKG